MRSLAPVVAFVCALILLVPSTQAHPGGLNGEGCHNNRKTGEYHCHRSTKAKKNPALSQPTLLMKGSDTEPNSPFASCAEARAAGAAPVRLGEAGYAEGLDRDGDGIGCE